MTNVSITINGAGCSGANLIERIAANQTINLSIMCGIFSGEFEKNVFNSKFYKFKGETVFNYTNKNINKEYSDEGEIIVKV